VNLVGIARTKNNQDIVEPFVRHHLQFLDHMLICDNGSVDGTKAILAYLANEDSRLILSRDDSFGDYQTEHYEKLLIDCESLNPDFVLPLDSDEFIQVSDRDALEYQLKTIPLGAVGTMAWRTYVLTKDTIAACAEDSPKGFLWRRESEDTPHGRFRELPIVKVVLRTEGQSLRDYSLWGGNHGASSRSRGLIPMIDLPIPLLHFPVRSHAQVVAKSIIHWAANLAHDTDIRKSGRAWHNQRNFDFLVTHSGISDDDLVEMSLMYAQNRRPPGIVRDPHGIQYERRYSTGQHMAPIPLVALAWEQSLTAGAR